MMGFPTKIINFFRSVDLKYYIAIGIVLLLVLLTIGIRFLQKWRKNKDALQRKQRMSALDDAISNKNKVD